MDGRLPVALGEKSGVNREVHAPICGSPGGKFPRATRLSVYRREHAGEEPPLTVSERARLHELARETRDLKMQNEFMQKAGVPQARQVAWSGWVADPCAL